MVDGGRRGGAAESSATSAQAVAPSGGGKLEEAYTRELDSDGIHEDLVEAK